MSKAPDQNSDLIKKYFETFSDVKKKSRPIQISVSSESIEARVEDQEQRQKELENDEFEQDIKLKKNTLFILFAFLGVETIAVFAIAFLQGFGFCGFEIEEWSFRTIVVSTILQITAMLTIAVKHLFPNKLLSKVK